MRACSCVCSEWNALVSHTRVLRNKRDYLDVCQPISSIRFYNMEQSDKNTSYMEVCVTPKRDGILACKFYNSSISIFNSSVEFVGSFFLPPSNRNTIPWSVCVFESSLFVTDYSNNRIQVFNQDYEPISTIPTWEFKPRHICALKSGYLCVSTHFYTILLMDQEGNILRRFGGIGSGDGKFTTISGICCNTKDQVIVCDLHAARIQIFDKDGNLLKILPCMGYVPTYTQRPHGICVDKDDNIVVTDEENERICFFTCNGTPIDQIRLYDRPHGVCIFGRKMIVSFENSLVVLTN